VGFTNCPGHSLNPAQVGARRPCLAPKQNIPYGKLAFRGQLPHKVYSVPLRRLVSNSAGAIAWCNCWLVYNPEMAKKVTPAFSRKK